MPGSYQQRFTAAIKRGAELRAEVARGGRGKEKAHVTFVDDGGGGSNDHEHTDPQPQTLPATTHSLNPKLLPGSDWLEPARFLQLQHADLFCRAVAGHISRDYSATTAALVNNIVTSGDSYTTRDDGIIVHLAPCFDQGCKVLQQMLVPLVMQPLVLRLSHGDSAHCHPGSRASLANLLQHFYWPGAAADMAMYVRSCSRCQLRKAPTTRRVAQVPVQPIGGVFGRLHIDLLDTHVVTPAGFRYVFAAVCTFSNYCWLFALKKKTALACARIMFSIVLRTGQLPEVVSDRGPEFVNDIMKALARLLRVHKLETTAYHPQANGIVERLNSRILQAIETFIDTAQERWPEFLEICEAAMRNTPLVSKHGLSAYFIVHGTTPRCPYHCVRSAPHQRRAATTRSA